MKKSIFMLLIIAAVFSACNKKSTETNDAVDETGIEQGDQILTVDAASSKLEWVAGKITGDRHNGELAIKEGVVNLKDGQIVSGVFTLDMTSINVLDIEDEEYKTKFLGHMASDDFFSTEAHPTAILSITKVENNNITANLTIKGIAKSITFPYTSSIADEKLTAEGSFTIDRTEWEIKYGSGKFFDNLGDKLIKDEIEIKVSISAAL